VPFSALPKPMLAKSGRLPKSGSWSYEVKWDGFRAIVSTEGPLRVRSRRGWNMTPHVGFLEQLPVSAVLDGELVAFDADGKPDFERVCERMLYRHAEVPLIFLAFDVLSLDGRDLRAKPYREHRESSGSSGWRDRIGGCLRRSRTARRFGKRSASTNSKA
jgi:bifunctional non-homologous end joining protein LigD